VSDEQTQQADDPSGPGWRDVEVGEILRPGDVFRDGHNVWAYTENTGVTVRDGWQRKYRRRIEPQQQPSDSEAVIDHRQCVKALQQIAQLADTGSKAHKERFCPNGEGDGIANGWRVAEAMREVANSVVGGVSLQQQPSDSEPETMEDLRRRLAECEVLLAEYERSGQQVNAELQQLRDQVQTLTRERDRYRNQLSGAIEHSSPAAARQQVLEALQTWLRPVLELVAEHPEDCSSLAVAVLGFLPGIASRLIEE
jgi:hypothetical protein